MSTTTINSKGQIIFPKDVRDALGLAAGDRVEFVAEAKGAFRVVGVTRDVKHLKGLVSKPVKPVSLDAMNRAITRARC
jgi:antitoxin PrlF